MRTPLLLSTLSIALAGAAWAQDADTAVDPNLAQLSSRTNLTTLAGRAGPTPPAQTQAARPQLSPSGPPPGSMSLVAPGGSDSCATATVISGTGTFPFNNGGSTTGTEGQLMTNCIQFNQISVPNDVWFLWTAPQTGRVEVGGCGSAGNIDTKIGVYPGPNCPAASGTALACNDDFTTIYLQARVFFSVTQNQQFLIQIGTSPAPPTPGTPGPDTFDIKYIPETCTHDDGSSEFILGLNAANPGEFGWLQRFGAAGENTIVSAVDLVWGSSWSAGLTPPAIQIVAGQAATIAVWEDPNDDGNPNDLVLKTTQATTIQNPNSDVFQTVTLASPQTLSGVYFLGAKTASGGALGPPGAADLDSCGVQPTRAFLIFQSPGTIDLANPNGATVPPTVLTAASSGLPGEWLLRGSCSPANAGVAFCFGDGTGTLCPCSPAPVPHGAAGKGCPTNIFPGGALAIASGIPSLTADSLALTATDVINGSMIFYQGATQQTGGAGVVFGDGKRCIQATGIRRFKTKPVAGNTMTYPGVGDNAISVAGAVAAPGPQQYQGWYRSANPTFCTVGTFNLTNGLTVTWIP